jgi:hypothetical protein
MLKIWYGESELSAQLLRKAMRLGKQQVSIQRMEPNVSPMFAANPRLIRDILYLDAPDLVVTSGRPEEPIIALEFTQEAGTGHDLFQRFARVVAAAEAGIPFAYVFPERKWVTRGEGGGWDEFNPLILRALLQVARFHNIPVLGFFWPAADHADPARGKLLFDRTHSEQVPRTHPDIRPLWEFVNLTVDFYQANRPFSEIALQPFYAEREAWMWEHFAARGGHDKQWSPLTQCSVEPTADLSDYVRNHVPNARPNWPQEMASRSSTVIYRTDSKTFGRDPYAGCLVAVDYLCCRQGPTRDHRHSNLCVHYPKASLEQVMAMSQRYHKRRCPLQGDLLRRAPDRNYTLHLRDGCRYTKQKELRTTCFFADLIIFRDGIIY